MLELLKKLFQALISQMQSQQGLLKLPKSSETNQGSLGFPNVFRKGKGSQDTYFWYAH